MKLYFGIALLLFSFPVQSDDVSCENPQTTVAISICSSKKVAVAESELDNYLATAIEKYAFEIKTIEALKESQNAWLLYRKTYCDAIYTL